VCPEPGRNPATRHSPLATPGRKSGIASGNLQEHLESAANAGAKGQAQYHTPTEWARILAQALPQYRPVLVDLTCGNGQLLAGAAAPSTKYFLGCDIEEVFAAPKPPGEGGPPAMLSPHFIQADLTRFYPLLKSAGFVADCFALNPPWDLHQYRANLKELADSDCPAVELAFAAHDGRTGKDTIDSTIATLCIALDRCSPYGEGLLIANESTLERLLFAPGAPHRALAPHIWAHLVIPGNICCSQSSSSSSSFSTGVIYFARSHNSGCSWNKTLTVDSVDFLKTVDSLCFELGRNRINFRRGTVIRSYEGGHTPDSAGLWDAAREEWSFLSSSSSSSSSKAWNIWLDLDGTIKTNLSLFDQASGRVNKEQYQRLFTLNGKHPMQLILQKAERKELMRAVGIQASACSGPPSTLPARHSLGDGGNPQPSTTPWRVAPAVTDAVRQALDEYNAVRAPLYPLSKIQRLGYLDENDDILCTKNLSSSSSSSNLAFLSGARYAIRTETIRVKRAGTKLNLTGERDEVEWEGSQLALFIRDTAGIERLFMEEQWRDKEVTLSIQDKGAPSPIEYNLQQLIEHFEIPEVPDVSTVHPQAFEKNLNLLDQIESIINL
jgi:predicted RNA methylase